MDNYDLQNINLVPSNCTENAEFNLDSCGCIDNVDFTFNNYKSNKDLELYFDSHDCNEDLELCLDPCGCTENIKYYLDASTTIGRLLKINMCFRDLFPGSKIGAEVTVYSQKNIPVANSSFEFFVPRNTSTVNKKAVITLPNENPCEKAEYSVVITYNTLL